MRKTLFIAAYTLIIQACGGVDEQSTTTTLGRKSLGKYNCTAIRSEAPDQNLVLELGKTRFGDELPVLRVGTSESELGKWLDYSPTFSKAEEAAEIDGGNLSKTIYNFRDGFDPLSDPIEFTMTADHHFRRGQFSVSMSSRSYGYSCLKV